jgi:hypothetical protein
MAAFIAREKGKGILGIIICAGIVAYSAIKGTSVWGPLTCIAFCIGIFAGAVFKERQQKREGVRDTKDS